MKSVLLSLLRIAMFESCQKAFDGLAVFAVGVVCPFDILEA